MSHIRTYKHTLIHPGLLYMLLVEGETKSNQSKANSTQEGLPRVWTQNLVVVKQEQKPLCHCAAHLEFDCILHNKKCLRKDYVNNGQA